MHREVDPTQATACIRAEPHVPAGYRDHRARTHEALCYAAAADLHRVGRRWSRAVTVSTAFYPRSAGIIWLAVTATGCAATALIVAMRTRARPREARDWRLIWALAALATFGAVWSYLLGPVVPRPMMYAFQPSLFLVGISSPDCGSDVSL